jgi:ribose 1,5-bisphosphate isomerase
MDNLKQTYKDIKSLKIQGATALTKALVSSLTDYGVGDKSNNIKIWQKNLSRAADYLLSARPTEPMARNAINSIFSKIQSEKLDNINQAKKYLKKCADEFLVLMALAAEKIIPFGQSVIKNNENILTHCHSWLVEKILISTKKSGKKFQVFNTETRPLYQGRITSKKLIGASIETTMISDSSAGFLISKYSGKDIIIDKVIIGADALLANGSVINKVGSYAIAASAFLEQVPVYVAAPLLKFYQKSWIKIEQRPPNEIWPNAPKKLKIINFAFDEIPAEWITGIICEDGIIAPPQLVKTVKKLYPWIMQ